MKAPFCEIPSELDWDSLATPPSLTRVFCRVLQGNFFVIPLQSLLLSSPQAPTSSPQHSISAPTDESCSGDWTQGVKEKGKSSSNFGGEARVLLRGQKSIKLTERRERRQVRVFKTNSIWAEVWRCKEGTSREGGRGGGFACEVGGGGNGKAWGEGRADTLILWGRK